MRPRNAGESVPVLNRQEELLVEIRDLLKQSSPREPQGG
jgi:large-conductance mechanosensitive channel